MKEFRFVRLVPQEEKAMHHRRSRTEHKWETILIILVISILTILLSSWLTIILTNLRVGRIL